MTLKQFLQDDSAAVTVDWVVVCAMVILLAMSAMQAFTTATVGVGDATAASMTSVEF